MSRFRPDGWGELLWRSFEMADMQSGLYVETLSPDVRPAALWLALALGAVLLLWRRRPRLSLAPANEHPAWLRRTHALALLAWAVPWFAWLAVSGNGRYALPLLVLVGPLLATAIWRLPMRQDWRWLALGAVALAQGVALYSAGPSQQWAMVKERWRTPHPFAQRADIFAGTQPDVLILGGSNAMTAQWVGAEVAQRARWLLPDFATAMGSESAENRAAVDLLDQAKSPLLLESYDTSMLAEKETERLTWRRRTQEWLAANGWAIDAASCRTVTTSLAIRQVACAVYRDPSAAKAFEPSKHKATPRAEQAMQQLITLCGASLWPHGARYAEEDGSLVQVFRESRYVVRAAPDGSLYVRGQREINFNKRRNGSVINSHWKEVSCKEILTAN